MHTSRDRLPDGKARLEMVYNSLMSRIIRYRHEDESRLLRICGQCLKEGGLVILPTDTVYGLAARVDQPEAVARIFRIKGRDTAKALVAVVSDAAEAAGLVIPTERSRLLRLARFWPGPLTVVAEAAPLEWVEWVAPGSTRLGIRVPDHPFLLQVLTEHGPLAMTSANLSGERAPSIFEEIPDALLKEVELAVDQGKAGSGRPSTVALLGKDGITLLREGDISREELERALRGEEEGLR